MKKIIFMFSVGLLFIVPWKVSASDVNPSAYGISVGSDWQYSRYCKTTLDVKVDNNPDYVIGNVLMDAFLYECKNNDLYDYDYYLVIFKLTITPKVSKKKYNWFYNYYGWSEYFEVSSVLPDNVRLTDYSPETENPSTSYTVGINGGYSQEQGLSAGISTAITVTKSTLKIKNNCNTSDGIFNIGYDYLCDISHDNDYLKKETMQYGMFSVQVPKGYAYVPQLKIIGKFAPAIGWSSFLQVAVTDRVEDYEYLVL